MDMLQILSMAKSNSYIRPVMEADDDAIEIDVTEDEDEVADYSEDVNTDEDTAEEDTGEEGEATDYTEDDPGEEDTTGDEESTDYTEDVDTEEVSEDGPVGEETPEEKQPEETKEDPEEANKKAALLDDFIMLHTIVKNNIDKLNSLTETDITINKVVIQVKKNLTVIQDALFTLIIRTYSLNTYVKNLYLYNYFTQSLAINIEMLKKISVFTTNTQNKYIKNN